MPYQVFTTSGTWTVPLTADPATIQVYVIGEGGASGDAFRGHYSGAAGGGGAFGGEPALGGLAVGSVLSFTIGQGGSNTDTTVTGGSVTVTGAHGRNGTSAGTAGNGGPAGANTIAFAGGKGGASATGSSTGGAGGGSAGSTGAGANGANGGGGSATGGAAGTGAAGPPSLAGAQGASSGSFTSSAVPGIAPGSGAAGAGENAGSPGGVHGGAGQVVIIWTTLNGIGLPPPPVVTITAQAPTIIPGGLTVTATAGGSTANGIILAVEVLDLAALPTAVNGGTQASASGQAAEVALTPTVTGSLVYSAVAIPTLAVNPTAAAGQTAIATGSWGGATYVSTATQTANTPFTAGATNKVNGSAAALEVTPFGGTIATDATTPAAIHTLTTTATTAPFTPPPGGKLLLALVAASGGSGVVSMAVTDTFGLTWTAAEAQNGAAGGYAGIWYAYTPANVAFVNAAPSPGVVGSAYSYTLTAAGGYGNYVWSVASGSLPAGLSLNATSGIISGTPTAAGLSTFTLSAADGFGNTITSGSTSLVINKSWTSAGVTGWTGAATAYSYGTLEIPVANKDHDWLFVSVSWEASEDEAIAYVADDVHNAYQVAAITAPGSAPMTQVFAVPDARAASMVYVSTSAYVRWLSVLVLDVPGLQPGYLVDTSAVYSGAGLNFTESLTTTQPDFILAAAAFQGSPQTVTQTGGGTGITWNAAPWAGINGSSTDGITQSAAWANAAGAGSPTMQFAVSPSNNYGGCMIAVYSQGGLPVNANPAWPVISCKAAFGYVPQAPTVPPTWTDITPRFLGLSGQRGRNFALDEISAADLSLTLDNFDGALSPGGSFGADLITPVMLTATWQGRVHTVFRGMFTSLAQGYDFQRGVIKASASDDFAKLPNILLPGCMMTEAMYDQPLSLWPMNEPQGATLASNWSGRSTATLIPTPGPFGGGATSGATQTGTGTSSNLLPVTFKIFGRQFTTYYTPTPAQASAVKPPKSSKKIQPNPPPTPQTPVTGFGNSLSGDYPGALEGTQDPVWGNTTSSTTSTYYQGTVLTDSNDTGLPLTSTGATYSVWAQMYYVPSNTNAVIMALTDQRGSAGSNVSLILSYNGTLVTAAQTAGSHTFTPSSYLFDSKWHLWTVTINTGGGVTIYLDGAFLGSFTGSFPAALPTLLQWGGDTTAATTSAAGVFTGSLYLGGVYDRAVDPERILTWFQAGATGFLDELAGTRIQRVLAWARWSGPQAVDSGVSLQQQFNYLGGGYGNSGLSGSIGNYATAGGSAGVDQGAQADVTIQDIANTDNGLLWMAATGTLGFRQYGGAAPAALPLGDLDYALNTWQTFEDGLGPWTTTSSCTVAQSAGWSYAGQHSALITTTGTPSQADLYGDRGSVPASGQAGFSCWVMSPQGCSVSAGIDWYTSGNSYISSSATAAVTIPPMTPVFLSLPATTAPATAAYANPHPIIWSPATGTQLYFDRARLSATGFQCPYGDERNDPTQPVQDIQYLYNDIAITRNVDQATYRARDAVSRGKYFPRVYTRTIYSSVDDATAVPNCATRLLTAFAYPATRVTQVQVDAAGNPETWEFVLGTDVGDLVSFTRNPVQGAPVNGTFLVLQIGQDFAPDRARFTYTLAPPGAF